MSTHSSSDSLSSTSLLVSPSSSTTSSPRPNYGWDQVRDILDSSSSSGDNAAQDDTRHNRNSNVSNNDDDDAHNKNAYHHELDLAMMDLTPDERRKLSLLMKEEYQRGKMTTSTSDSDEDEESTRRDLEDLFRSPKLIHANRHSLSPRRLLHSAAGGSPRRSMGSPDGKLSSSRSTPMKSPNTKSPSMKRPHPSQRGHYSNSPSLKRTPHSSQRPSSTKSSLGFLSTFSTTTNSISMGGGFFGTTSSSPNIEEWIGSQWSNNSSQQRQQQHNRETTLNQAITSSSSPSPQTQRKSTSTGKKRSKKLKKTNSTTSPQQQRQPQSSSVMQSPILSPPQNTSILSAFQSAQDTLDAALKDVNETLRKSSKHESRVVEINDEEEGETMTPDSDLYRGMLFGEHPYDTTNRSDGVANKGLTPTLGTWEEESDPQDVNLALALDFDLVAREDETAAAAAADAVVDDDAVIKHSVEADEETEFYTQSTFTRVYNEKSGDDQICSDGDGACIADKASLNEEILMDQQEPSKELSPVASTDNNHFSPGNNSLSEPSPNNILPMPSSHPAQSDGINFTSIHTTQSEDTHKDGRALESSESVKPNHLIPIPSPHPVHPNLVATHTSSFDNVTNDGDEEELIPSHSIPMPSPQPIRPDLSGRSKALVSRIPRLPPPQDRRVNDVTTDVSNKKRTLSIGKRSKVHPVVNTEGSVVKDLTSKSLKPRESLKSSVKAMLQRSNSYGGESLDQGLQSKSESKYPKKRATNLQRRQRSSSDAGLQSKSSVDSEGPLSAKSQQSSLLQRTFSSGSDPHKSLEAPSSLSPASRRRMEYDAKLRADKVKRKHDADKMLARKHSDEVEKKQDLGKSEQHVSNSDQCEVSPHSKVGSLKEAKQSESLTDKNGLTEECINDVVELVSESLDTSNVIYDDDLEAVAAAEMDESYEFEAAEKFCSELQSPLLHLRPKVSGTVALSTVGSEISASDVKLAADDEHEFGQVTSSAKSFETAVSPIVMSQDILSPSNETKERGETLPRSFDAISEKADDILSLCVDGQLLAEEEELFYDAHAFAATPVQHVLYQDNYEDAVALETEESRVFAENELHCSDASMMFEDAVSNIVLTPIPHPKRDAVNSLKGVDKNILQDDAANIIQKCYRRYQMFSTELNESDLDKCDIYLEPKLAVCVNKMQEMLIKHHNELNIEQGQLDATQKENYFDLYDDLMSIFNSKIREMSMANLSSDAFAIANIQQCIRTSHVRKDFLQLQQSLQTLQTRIGHHQSYKSSDCYSSQVPDTSSEIKKYGRGHKGMVSLQARARGSQTRRQMHSMTVNLVKLQSLVRMKHQLRRYKIYMAAIEQTKLSQFAAIKLQSCIRAMLKRNQFVTVIRCVVIFQRIIHRRSSFRRFQAIRIQAYLRGSSQRHKFNLMRIKFSLLQARARGILAREQMRKLKRGVEVMQSFGRMVVETNRFHRSIVSIAILQAAFRGHAARQRFSDLMQVKLSHSAAIKLQSHVLSMLYHSRYIRKINAVGKLQSFARMIIKRKMLQSLQINSQLARLQACVRGALLRRQNEIMHTSIVTIQAYIRGSLVRKQSAGIKRAVDLLQSYSRMTIQKNRFHKMVYCVTALQAIVRGNAMKRSHFQARAIHFRQRRTRVVKLQATVRAFTTRLHFKKAISGTIALQSRVRSMQQRKHYRRLCDAALYTQSLLRSAREKRRFHCLIHGIVLFQATVRGRQNKLLVCSKVAASVAWNDIMIASDNMGHFHEFDYKVSDSKEYDANKAAVRLQSLWRAFRDRIKVAKKLLLSWRMDCYYPSHIKNKMSFLRAGILVLKMANKGNDVLEQITSVIESDSYTDIHWRRVMTVDLSTAFGKKTGTFKSQVTLVVKFRRRTTRFFFQSHEYFVRATLLYALEREIRSLKSKCMELITLFIQSSLANARHRQCMHLLQYGEIEMTSIQVNAIKIQRFWRSVLYVLSSSEKLNSLPRSPLSGAERLRQLLNQCTLIQAVIRGFLLRKRQHLLSTKACVIQRAWSNFISGSKLRVESPVIKYMPIVVIQRKWKERRAAEPDSITSSSSGSSVHSDSEAENTMHMACITVQSHFRTSNARNQYNRQKFDLVHKNSAALVIQANIRMFIKRLKYESLRSGIIQIQALVRGGNARMMYYITYAATIKLQIFARQVLKKNLKTLTSIDEVSYPLTKLQATFRSFIQHSRFVKLRGGTILIQAKVRGAIARSLRSKLNASIIAIQAVVRRASARSSYKSVILAVQSLQAITRGHQQKMMYDSTLRAAVTIQSLARRNRDKSSLKVVLRGFVAAQAVARGMLQRTHLAMLTETSAIDPLYETVICDDHFAIKMQAAVRRYLAFQQHKKKVSGFLLLQSLVRGTQCRLKYADMRMKLDKLNASAQMIKLSWDKYKTNKVRQSQLFAEQICALEKALVAIQRKWILWQMVRRRDRAASTIQSLFRMKIAPRQLQTYTRFEEDQAAARLQALVRASATRRAITIAHQCASKIQWCFRQHVQIIHHTIKISRTAYSKKIKLQYESSAAIVLQTRARIWICQQHFLCRQSSAIRIQKTYRRWKCVRAEIERRQVDQGILRNNVASIKLQASARRFISRGNLKSANRSVCIIQQCYRRQQRVFRTVLDSSRALYEEELRLQYDIRCREQQELAAKTIQSIFRSWMRQKDLDCEKELVSAIDLVKTNEHFTPKKLSPPEFITPHKQSVHSPSVETKPQKITLSSPVTQLEVEHYERISAQIIQKMIRGWYCRSRFSSLSSSANKIQNCYRRHKSEYIKMSNDELYQAVHSRVASIAGHQKKRAERTTFSDGDEHTKILSSVKIQAVARQHIVRSKWNKLNHHAIVIQSTWRRRKVTSNDHDHRQKYCENLNRYGNDIKSNVSDAEFIERLIVPVQSIWRGVQARKHFHSINYAASVIQNAWVKYLSATNVSCALDLEFTKSILRVLKLQKDLKPCAETLKSHRLACALQAMWSGRSDRVQLKFWNDNALVIQKSWMRCRCSGTFNRTMDEQEYQQRFVSRIVSIQRLFRPMLAQSNMAKRTAVAIKIQKRLRTHQAKMHLSKMICSVKVIQATIRMYTARQRFLQMIREKQSIARLQSFARASIVRSRLFNQNAAALIIQLRFRVSRDMVVFSNLVHSAVVIQSFARRVCAQNFLLNHLQSCRLIQHASRKFLKSRHGYLLSSKATIIQKTWLRFKMRHCKPSHKENYTQFVKSFSSMQNVVKRRSHCRHEAAKKIQVLYFSWKMRLSLAKVLNSVVQIQKTSREYLSRVEKERFYAALVLQHFFKKHLVGFETQISSDETGDSDYLSEDISSSDSSFESTSFSEEDNSAASSLNETPEVNEPSVHDKISATSDKESHATIVESTSFDAETRASNYQVEKISFKSNFASDEHSSALEHKTSDNTEDSQTVKNTDKGLNLSVLVDSHDQIALPDDDSLDLGEDLSVKTYNEESKSVESSHAYQAGIKIISSSSDIHLTAFDKEPQYVRQMDMSSHDQPPLSELDSSVKLTDEMHRQQFLATAVQSLFRMRRNRKTLILLKESATRIQQFNRCQTSRKNALRERDATKIQSLLRATHCRQKLSSYFIHATKIQRCFQKYIRKVRENTHHRKVAYTKELCMDRNLNATKSIQSLTRCWLAKKKVAKINKEISSVKIQSFIRMVFAITRTSNIRSAQIENELKTSSERRRAEAYAAKKIQAAHRRYLAQRFRKNKLVATKEAAIRIQMFCRHYLETLQQMKYVTVIRIQSFARMSIAKRQLSAAKAACAKIQSFIRCCHYKTVLKNKFAQILVLQCWFRVLAAKSATLLLQTQGNEKCKAEITDRNNAVIVQRLARGYLVRRKLSMATNAARIIQRARRRSFIRLRNKLLQVFHLQSSTASRPVMRRSNSALLPKDMQRLNRIREIAPHLPRENGVFVEVILNSVVAVIQSAARRYIARKEYKLKLVSLRRIQRNWTIVSRQRSSNAELPGEKEKDEIETLSTNAQSYYDDPSSTAIRRRCISPSITDVEDSIHFSQDDPRLNSRVVRIQSIFRGSHVRKEQSICNSSAQILQGFLRRNHKSKLKMGGGRSECSSSIASMSSRSSYRLSTEDENCTLLKQIYQQAEQQVQVDTKSTCVSQYAYRLVLATEQELMFDG